MASRFPVLSVNGPRQSGKTTLCKTVFKDYEYVSLENPDFRKFALSDPKGFLNQYNTYVILDEVQNAPELFSYIQGIVDESNINGQYILSGSQNFLLSQNISQYLAERIYIFHLLPLSLEELKPTAYYFDNINDHIFHGGYPRIYNNDISPIDFYPSYIQTYLERDLRNIANVHDLNTFQQFIKICAGRIGHLINTNAIANQVGITHKTVKSWLSILESSFIIYRLKPWHKNFNKRIIKSNKLYFYDTGLACNLLGLKNSEELDLHFAKGALFENLIISEFIKNGYNANNAKDLYFWRDNTGHEVDMVIADASQNTFLEMKSSKTINNSFFKNLDYLFRISKNQNNKRVVIYGGDNIQKRTNYDIFPWSSLNEIFKS